MRRTSLLRPGMSTRILANIMRESCASALSQPVMSVITILIITGMCCAVLLTSGRAVGAEQRVLATLDSAGTKSIIVRAKGDAGLDSSVMDRVSRIRDIAWAGGFGPARDVHNEALVDGTKVPIRDYFEDAVGESNRKLQLSAGEPAHASTSALTMLGMLDRMGAVVGADGITHSVVGPLDAPSFLDFLEPVILLPRPSTPSSIGLPISVLVIVARKPELVAPVAAALPSLLGVSDMSEVTISTSADLATLRRLVHDQLSAYGRGLLASIFGVTAALVAVVLYGLVALRRRDFGRRRALGASQRWIVGFLLLQVAILSGLGALSGCMISVLALSLANEPLPSGDFVVAVAVQAVLLSIVAAAAPAAIASRRDPLRELRVA